MRRVAKNDPLAAPVAAQDGQPARTRAAGRGGSGDSHSPTGGGEL
jgi:hypothetical protein